MRKLLVIFLISIASAGRAQAQEHTVFSGVLGRHVKSGLVDYPTLCGDPDFGRYLGALTSVDPTALTGHDARLAFWINTYNAYTLKLICDHYPIESINELHTGGLILGTILGRTAWNRKIVAVGGELLSLGHIEHEILRKEFDDPRIHFALVCAAKGCPPLRSEAYEAARLNKQLNEQGRLFLSDPEKNFYDISAKTAHLSPIFSWFKRDFGSTNTKVLAYLIPFLPPDAAEVIGQSGGKGWRIQNTYYDWSLNEQ
jgi:hypothetical protein